VTLTVAVSADHHEWSRRSVAAWFTDRDAYHRYQAAFLDVFQRRRGSRRPMRRRASSSARGTGTRSCWCRFPTKLRSTSRRNLLITNGFRRTAAQAPTRWSCPSKQC